MSPRFPAALAVLCLAFPAAQAAPADDLVKAIKWCAAVPESVARLSCYDRIASQFKPAVGTPAAPPSAPIASAVPSPPVPPPSAVPLPPRPAQVAEAPAKAEDDGQSWFGIADWFDGEKASQSAQNKPEQFGSENLPPPPPPPSANRPAPIGSIAATVKDVAFNYFGRFTVFLDNGQIWKQLDSDGDKARFPRTGKVKVTISRGLIGSYDMQIEGQSRAYKVKRVK